MRFVEKRKKHPFKWIIWSIVVLFYFYEYLIRVSPSVMVPELVQSFNIDAETVGTISAFYFYAYAPMQFPVGVLTDRFGARRLLTFAALLCGIGTLMFAWAHSVMVAEIGRALMGIGSAFVFIGMIYVTTHWFEQARWSFLIGIANSVGMMGAVFGEGPLSFAVDKWGYRPTMFVVALAGFAIALAIILIMRNQPKEFHEEAQSWKPGFWLSLKVVLASARVWVVAFVSMGYYMSIIVIGALWGVPFLQLANGMSKAEAGFATSMIFFGFVVGGPIIGHFADYVKRKKVTMMSFLALTLVGLCMLTYFSPLPEGLTFILIFLIGFCSSAQLLIYALGIEVSSEYVKGTVTAFINGVTFLGGAILQPVIGRILDAYAISPGKYTVGEYQFGFSIVIAIVVLALIASFFTSSPRCEITKAKKRLEHARIQAEKRKG